MPWQPFRRKNKYREVGEHEMETSFDELLPRSSSDGNLVRWEYYQKLNSSCLLVIIFLYRAPSERFLLQNFDPRKTYGTCTGGSSVWDSFNEHVVEEGETLAGLSLRYVRWSHSSLNILVMAILFILGTISQFKILSWPIRFGLTKVYGQDEY